MLEGKLTYKTIKNVKRTVQKIEGISVVLVCEVVIEELSNVEGCMLLHFKSTVNINNTGNTIDILQIQMLKLLNYYAIGVFQPWVPGIRARKSARLPLA